MVEKSTLAVDDPDPQRIKVNNLIHRSASFPLENFCYSIHCSFPLLSQLSLCYVMMKMVFIYYLPTFNC